MTNDGGVRIMPDTINLINRQNPEIKRFENEYNKYPCKTVVGNNSGIHWKREI